MDENNKGKPWSRYMIQQHLDGDPAKKTVQDRLDELVELDVLKRYEYSNQTLYDLAYAPIVTDGGRLKDANIVELATLRDQNGIRDLVAACFYMSFAFFGLGVLARIISFIPDFTLSGSFYTNTAIGLYLSAGVLLVVLLFAKKLHDFFGVSE